MSKNNSRNKQTVGPDDGKNSLIRGIEEDAKKQAAEILQAAESAKKERIDAGNSQASSIIGEAKAKAADETDTIRKNSASLVSVDSRRQTLKLHEQVIALIMEQVQKKMESLVSAPEYPAMLKDWIVEGVIGLAGNEMSVNASPAEKKLVSEKLLRDAEKEVAALTGRKVTISVSKDDPHNNQGIAVWSSDKKTAYNNQVQTRLLRYESEIRKLIYRELFGE